MQLSTESEMNNKAMNPDILQEVPSEDIPNILKVMKTDWPKHFRFHQAISLMEERKHSVNKFNQTLYRYGVIESGVYILVTEIPAGPGEPLLLTMYQMYTKSADLSDLVKVLTNTSRISWAPGYGLEAVSTRFQPAITQVLNAKNINVDISNFEMLRLPPDVEIDLGTLPDDVCVKYLDESHAAEKDEMWPYRWPGSELYLAQQIKNNFGMGLFNKSDGKMLSSAMSYHFGGLFVLQTLPEHRSKGYATIIIKSMSKELRNRNQIPFCTITKDNVVSLRVFKKIGFVHFDDVCWIH